MSEDDLAILSPHFAFRSGFLALLALLSAPLAQAQSCEAPPVAGLDVDFASDVGDETTIEFETGSLDAWFGEQPGADLSGGVLIRRGNRLAGADAAEFDSVGQALNLDGNVRYADPNTEIRSDAARFDYLSGLIRFEGAQFQLADNARGSADLLQITQEGRLDLEDVTYTTCPPDSRDWLLEADDINLNSEKGEGKARDVKIRFKGVPIIWAPYLSFPMGNSRKSGILIPRIGSAGRSGNEISVPWYWNIRENMDATVSPRWLSNRGVQLGNEFRYLTRRNEGIAVADILANDNLLNRSRHLLSLSHRTLFDNGWRNLIDFREVSDSQYFEDLGRGLSITSVTHLNRSLQFDYFGRHWNLFGQVQDFQTLDETILPEDEPYRRLPQIVVSGRYPDQLLGLTLGFDGELVNFDRDTGVTGWRADALAIVELPIERPGWFVKPAFGMEYTQYELQNTLPGQDTNPWRSVSTSSIDMGMIFERSLRNSERLIATLEPRVLYVNVPFVEQDSLPIFDTIIPNLNFVQLYRKNRFVGVDRIGDTDQLSVGFTTRILDVNTGEELVTATIGQARYLSGQRITLPGQPALVDESSDYIAEIRFLLYENLNFDIGHQWGSEGRGTTQSEARLQYRPATNKILNLAYRFRRASIEQGDVSWSWPVGSNWNFVGRYNYSFRDEELLEELYGVEYETCCWGFRTVYRRFLSTRDGTRDSSIGLQIVLKGLMDLGTAADRMLERGILGYSSDLD